LLAAALLLAAVTVSCAATAPIRPDVRNQATPVDFAELATNPEEFRGETVILGGVIISATPIPEGTQLVVLETKTEGDERPGPPDTTQGRFVAVSRLFLDPQVYQQGRPVTVAGVVVGKATQKIGEVEQSHPLIAAEQVYLWPPPEPRYYSYYPYYPYYYEPFYPGPFFFSGPFFFERRERFRGERREEREERGEEFRGRGAARPAAPAPPPHEGPPHAGPPPEAGPHMGAPELHR
jgi:outer membrane lipoprotein